MATITTRAGKGSPLTNTEVDANFTNLNNDKAETDGATLTNVDINSGTIDGVTIGGASAGAGTFTTITGSGDMAIDTDTLYVDATNNRVGVGTDSPAYNLEVAGSFPSISILDTDTTNDRFRILHNGGSSQIQVDPNNVSASSSLLFSIDGSEAMRIDSSGNVGIGATNPDTALHVGSGHITVNGTLAGGATFQTASGSGISTISSNDASNDNFRILQGTNNSGVITFTTRTGSTNVERMRIDNSGNVGIGTTDPAVKLDVNGSAYVRAGSILGLYNTDNTNQYQIYNGGASGANIGQLVFLQGGVAERMRIDSSGALQVGKTAGDNTVEGITLGQDGQITCIIKDAGLAQQVLFLNRQDSDGTLILFRQGNATEGSISVSGSTVSYNGGHLARWSRLADDSKDTSIVKGTVMTNLDAMVEWSHDAVEAQDAVYETVTDEEGNEMQVLVSEAVEAKEAYTEDNEQLNKMAVSSVEGDPNVAGVFVNWDEDDDDFNDMNIAMTGDMVIRIAQGTTVARGDLLMSAGDGTAKPQGDDIVRSKTIAKVTSTHVSHTYDDGSYLVPCVLMAC